MAYSMAFNPRNILTALPTAVLSARDRDLEIFRLGVGLRAPKQRDRITAYETLSRFHPEFQEAQIEKLADNMPQRELQALQKKYYQDRTRPIEQQTQTETQTEPPQMDIFNLFGELPPSGGGGGGVQGGSGFFEPGQMPSTQTLLQQANELTRQFEGLTEETNLQNPFGRGTQARQALIRERRAGGGFIAAEDVTAQQAAEQLLARVSGTSTPERVTAGLRTKGKIPTPRNVLFGVGLSAREMSDLPESFQQEALMERGALAQGTDIIEEQSLGSMALERRRAQERGGLSEFETEEFTGRPPPTRLRGKGRISTPAVKLQMLEEVARDVAEDFGGQYASERRAAGGGAAIMTAELGIPEQELPLPYTEMIARGLLEVQEEFDQSLNDPRGDFINYIRRNPTRGNLEGFRRYIREQLNPTRMVSRQ